MTILDHSMLNRKYSYEHNYFLYAIEPLLSILRYGFIVRTSEIVSKNVDTKEREPRERPERESMIRKRTKQRSERGPIIDQTHSDQ